MCAKVNLPGSEFEKKASFGIEHTPFAVRTDGRKAFFQRTGPFSGVSRRICERPVSAIAFDRSPLYHALFAKRNRSPLLIERTPEKDQWWSIGTKCKPFSFFAFSAAHDPALAKAEIILSAKSYFMLFKEQKSMHNLD